MTQKEKSKAIKFMPIFCAVVGIGILLAYTILIYQNNQYKKITTEFLTKIFATKVTIESFEYSQISNNLHITNLSIHHKDNKNIAITIQDIRATINNMKEKPLNIADLNITGLILHTNYHNGEDLIELLQIPENNSVNIKNINILEPILYAPAIKDVDKTTSFTLSNISTNKFSDISNQISDDIQRKLLKHSIYYKIHSNKAKMSDFKNKAIDSIDKNLDKASDAIQQEINDLKDGINSIYNK